MTSFSTEFEYLKLAALRFGTHYEWHEIRDFGLSLTLNEQAEIRKCYDEISARQDWEAITEWLSSRGISSWDESLLGNLFRLLLLFDVMGTIGLLKPPPERKSPLTEFDWTSIPSELGYLIGAAKRYGRVAPGEAQSELISWLSSTEIVRLRQLALRLGELDQAGLLEHWIDAHDSRLFPEAILVRNLYELLKRVDEFGTE